MTSTLDWLRARTDDELAELLTARADLLLPAPSDLVTLARRIDSAASVRRAVGSCNAFELQVLQAVWVRTGMIYDASLGGSAADMARGEAGGAAAGDAAAGDAATGDAAADRDKAGARRTVRHTSPGRRGAGRGVTAADIATFLGGPADTGAVRKAVDRLHRHALLRLAGARYVLAPQVREALGRYPAGLGQPVGLSPEAVHRALATCSDAERALLGRLVPGPPVGSAPADSAHRPAIADLVETGLLLGGPDGTVILPQEVALALRGPQPLGPASAEPPAAQLTWYRAGTVDGTAAGQALAARRRAVVLLDLLGTAPLPALKSGGIGIVPLRQLAKQLDVDIPVAALYLELLHGSGLIAPVAGRGEISWVPTQRADTFLAGSESAGWALLAQTWLDMRRDPSRVGSRDTADKVIGALTVQADWRSGPAERRRVLREIAAAAAEADDTDRNGTAGSDESGAGAARTAQPLADAAFAAEPYGRPAEAPGAPATGAPATGALVGGAPATGALAGGSDRLRRRAETGCAVMDPAPDQGSVINRLLFHAPLQSPEAVTARVAAVVAEATELGVVAFGAISSAGRALLEAEVPEVAAALEAMAPPPVETFLVQADMTVIAPGRLARHIADALAEVADVESAGGGAVYRLSEASVRRALDAGMTRAEISTLFERYSSTPVPQSMTYLIEDVARRHGVLRAGRAESFVHSDDPALVTQAIAAAGAAGLTLRALAPTVAVSPVDVTTLVEALRAAGLTPAAEDATGNLLDLRPAPRRTRAAVPSRAAFAEPAAPSAEQIAAVVRRMRAGDRILTGGLGQGGLGQGGSRQGGLGPQRTGGAAGTAGTARAASGVADTAGGMAGVATDLADIVILLREAARGRAPVWIAYADREGGTSTRAVEPIAVSGGAMVAFDRLRQAARTFTLSRISSAHLDGP